MADITNTSPVVTEDKLKDFYEDIKPFLGCPAYLTSEGNSDYYSTDEKVIGRWTDGKPLYQKVIYFNPQITITANSWQNIKSDETDIECIADAIILRNDGIFIPQYGNVSPFINTRGLWVYTTQLQNAIQGIILKYTKITDSATTTIQEDPNEYSTDEKIIGKWIDGKPIYQKTVSWGAISNGTHTKDASSWNIDNLIEATGFIKRSTGEILTIPNYYMVGNQGVNWLNYYGQNIAVLVQGFDNITDCYVTYKYTKTTD